MDESSFVTRFEVLSSCDNPYWDEQDDTRKLKENTSSIFYREHL
jgi:hypothetical protein